MVVTLSWQTVLTAAAVVGAFVALVAYLRKLFGWFERQEKQEWLIRKLKEAMPRLTAERIYRWLLEQELPPQEISCMPI